jgi:hypothetical protein
MKMFGRDGAAVEIPDDQVQEAFQSGQFGFAPDARIPIVTRTGKWGTIPATSLDEAIDKDARVTTPDEYKLHRYQEKYGQDLPHEAAASVEALARGITAGGFDPLAIGAARAVLGKEAAESTREHLEGEREANPVLATGGEIVGTALPFLVPGGELVEGAGAVAKGTEAAGAVAKGLEGAEAVQAASRARQGVQVLSDATRTVGFVPRGIAHLGDATERAISAIVGKDAGSFAGRAAQKIAAKAGAAAVEGAAYNDLSELDEAALGDEKLNGEKLVAAAKHGALLAGTTVGLLTGGGQLARELAGRASPLAERLAGIQAYKAYAPTKAFRETAMRRLGGPAEMGKTALRKGLFENAATVDDLYRNTEAVIEKEGPALGAAYDASGASVRLKDTLLPFDEAMEQYRDQTLHAEERRLIAKAKAEYMAAVAPELGQEMAEKHIPGGPVSDAEMKALVLEHGPQIVDDKAALEKLGIRRIDTSSYVELAHEIPGRALTQEDLQAIFRTNPKATSEIMMRQPGPALETLGIIPTKQGWAYKPTPVAEKVLSNADVMRIAEENGGLGLLADSSALAKLGIKKRLGFAFERPDKVIPAPTPESIFKAAEETQIPIKTFIEQRQALGRKAYPRGAAQNQNDPNGPQKVLREIYSAMNEIEDEAFQRADKTGKIAADLKKQRMDYARLKHLEMAAIKSNARNNANVTWGLRDMMILTSAIMSGHVGHGIVGTIAYKYLRERGNAYAARILDKLAKYGAVERASSVVDREIERGIAGVLKPGERAGVGVRERAFAGKDAGEDYDKRVEAVTQAVAHADQHADHVGKIASTIAAHAPNTAKAFQRSALAITSYLASRIPQGQAPPPNTLQPHLEKPRVSDADKAKFNRAFDMGNDPVGVTFDRLKKGMLTQTDVANLRAMYPAIYGEIRQKTMEALATQGTKLDFNTRMQLGLLLDIPADPAIEPLFMATMQSTFEEQEKNEPPPKPKGAAPKRTLQVFEEKAKLQAQ